MADRNIILQPSYLLDNIKYSYKADLLTVDRVTRWTVRDNPSDQASRKRNGFPIFVIGIRKRLIQQYYVIKEYMSRSYSYNLSRQLFLTVGGKFKSNFTPNRIIRMKSRNHGTSGNASIYMI